MPKGQWTKTHPAICAACGASFMTRFSRGKYCSAPCRLEGLRASIRRCHYRRHDADPAGSNAKSRASRKTEGGRRTRYEQTLKSRQKFPEKNRARWMVGKALQSGTLIKQPCACGATQHVHAHHADYSKPLDVEWLCDRCHRTRHPVIRHPEVRNPFEDGAVVAEPAS
jgi:hypothetical protein